MRNETVEKDFLSINEFAEIVGMSIGTLRYYDNEEVFRPAKRGEGAKDKFRYYSPAQIKTVKMIRVLTEVGVPLQAIRELCDDRTPYKLIRLFRKYRRVAEDEQRFLGEVYSIICTFLELLNEGISITEDEIHVSELDERPVIMGDVNDFTGETGFARELTRFCNSRREPRINLSYPVGGYFDSMDMFLGEPSQPTRFFYLDPNGYEKMEAGLYLVGYTRGYYSRANDLPMRMAEFAKKNGLQFNGPVYIIYLFDEVSVVDPDRYLLQASASVSETRRASLRRACHKSK